MHPPSPAASLSAESLNERLRAGRSAVLDVPAGPGSAAARPLTLVLGNEACDLDSVACAVALAALRARGGGTAAAVLGCDRADLRLRPEVAWLLETHGVDPTALLCADDGLEAAYGRLCSAPTPPSVSLVGAPPAPARCRSPSCAADHNKLSARWEAALGGWVSEVVDHHDESGAYPSARHLVAPLASCSTLVARARRAPRAAR